nr:hypothetical protein [Actinosynnema mirum]
MNGLTSAQVVGVVGALLVLLFVWRAGARRARATARATQAGVRLVSLAGRVLVNAAVIVLVQWVVITHRGNGWLLFGVLAVPALFAAHTLTRALTVTTYEPRRGGRR